MHGTPFARPQWRTRSRRTTWTRALEYRLTGHRASWSGPDRSRTRRGRGRCRRSRRRLIYRTRSGLRNDHPRTRWLSNRSPGSYCGRSRWNLWSRCGRSRRSGRHRRGCGLGCRRRHNRRCGLWRHRGWRRSRCRRCGLLHRRRGDGECRTRRGLRNNQPRRSCRRCRSLWGGRSRRYCCRSSGLGFHRRRNDCGTRGRRSRGGRSWRRRLLLGTNGVQYVSRLGYVG